MGCSKSVGFRVYLVVAGILLFVIVAQASEEVSPEEIPGLVAWYESETLKRELSDGNFVEKWTDSSGNGHDLVFDGEGKAAVFHAIELNRQPAVEVRKTNRYAVVEPFELEDHTIFLVYRTRPTDRVLFASKSDPSRGLVLKTRGRDHEYRNGEAGHERAVYTTEALKGGEFSVTTLGRESGVLRAFVDGLDVSSGHRFSAKMEVGRFFDLYVNKMVSRDAEGLWISEMLFYGRFLAEPDREAVESYLFERYSLVAKEGPPPLKDRRDDLPPPAEGGRIAWLSGAQSEELNRQKGERVVWKEQKRADSPFRHEATEHGSRLHCTEDGQRVRFYVALQLRSAVPGVGVRLLILKNEKDYLVDQSASVPFVGEGEERSSVVELETSAFLNKGDFVEVFTFQDGQEGRIALLPEGSLWVAEAW